MKKFTKLLAVGALATTLISTALVGCGQKQQAADSKKIGMVISTLNNPFFVQMKEGAEAKAKEMGYEIVIADSQNDASKERSNVEDLLQKGVSALIVNPTDSDAVVNAVKLANDQKIPVITVDRKANGGDIASHVASDNVKGGEMAAKFIIDKMGGKSDINVVELQGLPGASATRDRGEGFHNVADKNKSVKVVAAQAADFDRQKGLTVTENIIQAQPKFDAIFAHNDEMALGAVKALKTAKKNVIVVGFDGNEDALNSVKKGEMTATVAQQPKLMGEIAVENAVKKSKGETVEKEIPVDLKLVEK